MDFTDFVKEWTIHVHLAATENQDKNNKTYYKLSEQLEKHHQAWVKSQGENTTLSNTERMRAQFTKIVTSKEQGTRKGEYNTKRYVLLKYFYNISFPSKKIQARERRKKVQCKLVC